MPTKSAAPDSFSPGSSSVPLLVRMPDGERRQVDVAPNASIKDLKSSIVASLASRASSPLPAANTPPSPNPDSLATWDLDFGGSVLQDSATLNDYNIPDVYDHASGLLKTITESAHADAGKKVEALDKACAVVQGISRGEKDMERLISAVFDSNDEVDDTFQPSLGSLRRKGRSRIPTLNFSSLAPVTPLGTGPSPRLTAPPTPSQLLRRLSYSRPDLYNPAAAARADPSSSGDLKKQSSWFSAAVALGAPDSTGVTSGGNGGGSAQSNAIQGEGGDLKRGMTWFTDVFTAIGKSVPKRVKLEYNGDGDSEGDERGDANDVEGDSEDEDPKRGNDNRKEEQRKTMSNFANAAGSNQISKGGDESKNGGKGKIVKRTDKGSNATRNASETMTAAVHAATAAATSSTHGADKTEAGSSPGANNRALSSSSSAAGDHDKVQDEKRDEAPSASIGQSFGSNANETTATGPGQVPAATSTGSIEKKPSGFMEDTERQVIGLEPEQLHLGDDIKIPKKRGRKRKNPHLSEEERKAQRQAQNRESAKLSRIRRKTMTAEYEKRVTTLEGENENLRDTVAALTDRLEILQNLLTISVQKRPIPQQALQQPLQGMQTTQGLVQNTQALMPTVTSALGTRAALNSQVGVNPQTGLNAQISLNPATSLAATLQQSTSLNHQRGLNSQTAVPRQAHHLTNLNMGYKNY